MNLVPSRRRRPELELVPESSSSSGARSLRRRPITASSGLGIRVPAFIRQLGSGSPQLAEVTAADWISGSSSKASALSIPTVSSCRDLIVGAAVQMGVFRFRGTERIASGTLLTQPDPETVWSATLAGTIEDLIYHGRGYWLVLATDGIATQRNPEGLPVRARWIPFEDVEEVLEPRSSASSYVRLLGYRIAGVDDLVDPRFVIRFDSPLAGVLERGAEAIATALALEAAAERMADVTIPAGTLTNEGEPLDETEAEALVARFEEQRATHGVAFLQDVTYARESLSAEDLQLVAARANSATEMARLHNMPVTMVSASPSGGGSAMLYANLGSQLTLMVSSAVSPYLVAVEQTLSRDDVTTGGTRVAFDVPGFLRSDPNDLKAYVLELLKEGVIDKAEARAMLGISDAQASLQPGSV